MAEESLAGNCQGQHTRHLCLEPVVEEDVIVPQYNTGEEAVVVWDSALVLSYFLLKHREKFIQGSKHILELGAGTGAVGLVAAALGAEKVTVTDLPRFVPLLKEAISLNPKLSPRINVQALTWGDSKDLKSFLENKPLPDLILVSDCIYYEASIQPLISTLENLCKDRHPECKILLSYESRDYLESKKKIAAEFFRTVGELFWIKPFKTSDCHEDYASDDIRVIQLMLK